MTIIYYHGYGSSGTSQKSLALREAFGYENVHSPDLPYDFHKITEMTREIISEAVRTERTPVIMVGTSLGGFYAGALGAMFACPAIMINPVTNPSERLKPRIGIQKKYDSDEEFEITSSYIASLRGLELFCRDGAGKDGEHKYLFLAKDDDVIDYTETLANIPHRVFLAQYPTGGHRFEERFPQVIDYIRQTFSNKEVE